MPKQHWLEIHHEVLDAEREPLTWLKDGLSDEAIAAALGIGLRALRSRLHRFYERTALDEADSPEAGGPKAPSVSKGRRAVAWCNRHEHCCLTVKTG